MGTTLHTSSGLAACRSLGACMHVRACSVGLVIMRHCSHLNNNLITKLPAQIFGKNVQLEQVLLNDNEISSLQDASAFDPNGSHTHAHARTHTHTHMCACTLLRSCNTLRRRGDSAETLVGTKVPNLASVTVR